MIDRRIGTVVAAVLACVMLASAHAWPTSGATPSRAAWAAAQQAPCAGPEHRQFDFWLGDWDVTNLGNPQGPSAHNEITSILGGCVLLESYETPGGFRGSSYNAFDRATGRWHQTWVDNSGLVLKLDGGIVDGDMVLEGRTKDRTGQKVLNRIRWAPRADGSVQQTWLSSADEGETWTTVFDGLYRKRGS